MMRKRLMIVAGVLVAAVILAATVVAQNEVPPPYTGLKNPFSWDDSAAQAAGKTVYRQYCLGCHGVTGNGVASADFSARDYPLKLESAPDFYYWIVSEGSMDTGMPSFKASLSDNQRWQVLTYIWYLGNAPTAPPTTGPPGAGYVGLNAVNQGEVGQPLVMSAVVFDPMGKPIQGQTVYFFTRENFITTA
jgi:mono/diheme cytochrome c family protein